MEQHSTRTIISPCFLEANELPVSKLPNKLKTSKDSLLWSAERDCKQLVKFVQMWKHEELYKHFSPSWEEFVEKQLDKPLEWIDAMIAAANILEQHESRKNDSRHNNQ